MLELTSRCNLRCVYCALSQPEFHGQELALDTLTILQGILSIRPVEVQINGHGESTIIEGWNEIASKLSALEGEPGEECRICPARGRTSPRELGRRVAEAQEDAGLRSEVAGLKSRAREQEREIERLRVQAAEPEAERVHLTGILEGGGVGLWRRGTAPAKRVWRAITGRKGA